MEDKDFFGDIKKTLNERQEPYDNGAWEDFCQERRRRDYFVVSWRYAGIAAGFLLILGCLWFMKHPAQQNEEHYAKHTPKGKPFTPHNDAAPSTVTSPDIAGPAIAGNNNPQKVQHYFTQHTEPVSQALVLSKTAHADNPQLTEISKVTSPDNGSIPNNIVAAANSNAVDSNRFNISQNNKTILANVPAKKIQENQHSLYDSLVKKRPTENIKKTANNNLLYAVAIHPAVGNKKVSIGAGLEVAYPFNEHLSLGSGVSFASLHAETTAGNETGLKQLQSTDLDVTGIELPLTLSYRVKNGFYLNAGISAVAILSNQLSNNYLIQGTQTVTQLTSGGVAQQTLQVVSNKSTEQTAEQLSHFLGFYTFTIGKKQAVGKNQIDFGPFLKVPFNPVSSQNVRFTQGGFRLSFGF